MDSRAEEFAHVDGLATKEAVLLSEEEMWQDDDIKKQSIVLEGKNSWSKTLP